MNEWGGFIFYDVNEMGGFIKASHTPKGFKRNIDPLVESPN